ncbi:glycoside hydrolase superfamily, partial [Auriculariales sp. MPI-PUGE-AT-0066]
MDLAHCRSLTAHHGHGNWAASVARAKAFVAGLTLEEKVKCVRIRGVAHANIRMSDGPGLVSRLALDRRGVVLEIRAAFPVLALTLIASPGFCLQDGPLGVRFADFASAFPAEITAASTWDVELIYARAQAMEVNSRVKLLEFDSADAFGFWPPSMQVALGPMTNLARVVRLAPDSKPDGRTCALIYCSTGCRREELGRIRRRPYLSGIMSAETVKGLQDKNAWPFADAIHAGVGSVMCSYNRINQTYACENSKLLNGIMKEELGFQGFLLSDWAAMKSGVSSALAGTDMNMPGFKSYGTPVNVSDPSHETNSWWGANLVDAVNNGSVSIERWTTWSPAPLRHTTRLDKTKVRLLPLFSRCLAHTPADFPTLNFDGGVTGDYRDGVLTNEHVNVQDNHKDIIRKVAAAGTVLVKNVNGALPLKLSKSTRLGVFGSDAGPHPVGPNLCSTGARDKACDEGTLAMGWGSGTANFPYLVDPLAAISTHVLNSKTGATIEGVLDDYAYTAISTIAQYADACIVFANADSGESYLTVDTNAGDRNNLTYRRAVDRESNVTAVLFAHLPGQESGNAIVDVLFGAVNPSGKLPYT